MFIKAQGEMEDKLFFFLQIYPKMGINKNYFVH